MKSAVRWITSIELNEKETMLVLLSSYVALGGTSESDAIFSPTVRKHLRKTRLELLHKEYEVRTGGVLWLSRWTAAVKLQHTNGPFALSPAMFNLTKGVYCIYMELSCIKMPPFD